MASSRRRISRNGAPERQAVSPPLSSVLLSLALVAGLTAGCSDSSTGTGGPSTFWGGTYVGEFQGFGAVIPDATLQVGQSGYTLTGTLEVGGRSASLEATLEDDDTMEGTFTFTGECPGSASTFGEFQGGGRLLGTIQGTDDCGASLDGTYNLMRQP